MALKCLEIPCDRALDRSRKPGLADAEKPSGLPARSNARQRSLCHVRQFVAYLHWEGPRNPELHKGGGIRVKYLICVDEPSPEESYESLDAGALAERALGQRTTLNNVCRPDAIVVRLEHECGHFGARPTNDNLNLHINRHVGSASSRLDTAA